MANGWTAPITEGPLQVRFKTETGDSKGHTLLVRELSQPGRDEVLEFNKLAAIEASTGNKPRDLSFGRYLGSIPVLDFLNIQKSHPDLFSSDPGIARPALIKFWNSTEGRPYRVQRA